MGRQTKTGAPGRPYAKRSRLCPPSAAQLAGAGRRGPAAQTPTVSEHQQHLAAGRDALLNGIAIQVADIKNERIAALNQTLRCVDFQPGLPFATGAPRRRPPKPARAQPRPGPTGTESLRDDGGHRPPCTPHHRDCKYKAIASKRRSKAAQAPAGRLLPPAVCRAGVSTGPAVSLLERRTGSQGGSGGEKEIIASYVLTACSATRCAPMAASRPVFAPSCAGRGFPKARRPWLRGHPGAARVWPARAVRHAQQEVRLLHNHTAAPWW